MNMSRKRIAVITARADDGEQGEILLGITEAAMSLGVDTAVFSNIYNHWITDEILNYENIIYDLFTPEVFDGVIITAEAFRDFSVQDGVVEKIRKSGITAVVIGRELAGFTTVNSNDGADMEQIAEHLISVHHFTDIDILTGGENDPSSRQRLGGCIRAFERNGIKIKKNKIHYGNHWTDSGEALAQRYIKKEIPLPEAVICTNDYMAYGLCDALVKKDIKIPETLSVTGYDYIGGRIFHYPFITTYKRGRREMGIEAVNIILQAEYAAEEGVRFIGGDTCSCGTDSSQLAAEITGERINQHRIIGESTAQFASRLTVCRTLAEYISVLGEFSFLLKPFGELRVCLDTEWNGAEYGGKEFLCCKISDDCESLTPERISGVLPSILTKKNEKPMVFYFSPLVFQTRLFGYTVIAYDRPSVYDFRLRDWQKNAGNALEFLRMKNDIHYLSECQRVSPLYDSLTGFYNLGKFRNILEETEKIAFCVR